MLNNRPEINGFVPKRVRTYAWTVDLHHDHHAARRKAGMAAAMTMIEPPRLKPISIATIDLIFTVAPLFISII
ncbi:hypothetical protein DPM33_23610 [Mesorhizobium hawassense]|uniref:Uncharacterized protein n=1 Tax=Mesorhizobium hawassense TaxID=1209954 RepID=A0A330HJD9_9HYPH|nr:hypothetical protein DPM33_23610 [Mesorhizobium hawassense]